jgi:3',5'-cyclic AMP phosphodiesterase CpdA
MTGLEKIIKQATKEALQDRLKDYNFDEIKNTLLEFPEKIKNQKMIVSRHQEIVEDLKQQIEQEKAIMESVIMAEIEAEKDEKGKLIYSNADKRNRELIIRFANLATENSEYQELVNRFKEAEKNLQAAQFELETIENSFKVQKYIVKLIESEVKLITG